MEIDNSIVVAVISAAGAMVATVVGAIPTFRAAKEKTRRSVIENFNDLIARQHEEIARIDTAVTHCREQHDACEQERREALEELHQLRMRVDRLERRMTQPGNLPGA